MKKQNGITLVALILTIILMLILSFIAIGSIKNTNILSQTENAASKLNQSQQTENTLRNELFNTLQPGDNPSDPNNSTEYDDCNHIEEIIPAIAATCTKNGLTEGIKCSVCNKLLVAQQIISASHGETTTNYGKQNDYKHSITEICDICKEAANPTTYEYHDYYPYKGFSTCGICNHECKHSQGVDYYGHCVICGVLIKNTGCNHENTYRKIFDSGEDTYHYRIDACLDCNEILGNYSSESHEYDVISETPGVCLTYDEQGNACGHVCTHGNGNAFGDDCKCSYCGIAQHELSSEERALEIPEEDRYHEREYKCRRCGEWVFVELMGDAHTYTEVYNNRYQCQSYNCYHYCQHRDGDDDQLRCSICGWISWDITDDPEDPGTDDPEDPDTGDTDDPDPENPDTGNTENPDTGDTTCTSHSWITTASAEATCINRAWHKQLCSKCGAEQTIYGEGPTGVHTWGGYEYKNNKDGESHTVTRYCTTDGCPETTSWTESHNFWGSTECHCGQPAPGY